MTLLQIPIENPVAWRTLRHVDVTASVVGALLGAHPYQTPYGIYARKRNLIPDPEETPAMRRGLRLEPIHLDIIREEEPDWNIWNPKVYVRDPDVRLGATPDLFCHIPDRGLGVIQMKSVEESAFRREWRDGESVTPPLWIICQVLTEAYLSGADFAMVSALKLPNLEREWVEVPIHRGLIERIKARTREFWVLYDTGRSPPVDWGRDGDVIEAMFPEDAGSYGMLPPAAASLVTEIYQRRDQVAKLEAEILPLENQLKAMLGNHEAGYLPDGRVVSWKTQRKKAGYVAGSVFRVLRLPRRKV